MSAFAGLQLTEDTATITRVWATFNYQDVFPEIDLESDDETIPADFDSRLAAAYDRMHAEIASEFPNATDIWVMDGGWDGSYAQFSPRADGDAGDYEHFFEWLTGVCDTLGETA